jgi:hypothetical protein
VISLLERAPHPGQPATPARLAGFRSRCASPRACRVAAKAPNSRHASCAALDREGKPSDYPAPERHTDTAWQFLHAQAAKMLALTLKASEVGEVSDREVSPAGKPRKVCPHGRSRLLGRRSRGRSDQRHARGRYCVLAPIVASGQAASPDKGELVNPTVERAVAIVTS